MKRVWITDSGIIHHRKPRMDATEYVEVTDQGLLERTAMRLAYENDKLRTAQQQPDAELLEALIGAREYVNMKYVETGSATTGRFLGIIDQAIARAEQKGGVNHE